MTDPLIANFNLDPDLQQRMEALVREAHAGDWRHAEPHILGVFVLVQQQRGELSRERAAWGRLLAAVTSYFDALDRLMEGGERMPTEQERSLMRQRISAEARIRAELHPPRET